MSWVIMGNKLINDDKNNIMYNFVKIDDVLRDICAVSFNLHRKLRIKQSIQLLSKGIGFLATELLVKRCKG